MELFRKVTGIISTYGKYCEVDGKSIEEMITQAMGTDRKFAGTIIISVVDLTEDSGNLPAEGAPNAAPDPNPLGGGTD